MKENSHLLVDSVENFNLLEEGLHSDVVIEELLHNSSPEVKPGRIENESFLKQLWKRLVFWPESFPQNPNTMISTILEEDTGSLASGPIRSVLSKKLELSMNSEKLSRAIEDSFKIFHEDYPGDFILEYKGERLGIMLLDKCFNLKGEAKLVYRFNPQIKSFRGLF